MATLIKNVRVIDCRAQIDVTCDVFLTRGEIALAPSAIPKPHHVFDGTNKILIPGLVDLHVHFREPGFTHKEDIASGIKAALAGGITSALVMPNTNPVLDQPKRILHQRKRAQPFGFHLMVASAASKGLLGRSPANIADLKRAGAKAVTDDGKPILDPSLMVKILKECRKHNLVCMQHAEDLHISQAASLTEGRVSRAFNLLGQPARAEFELIKRDIALAQKIGARYHVLHLSCKESLNLVRAAKRAGVPITCEVSPHHLMLTEESIGHLSTNKKMNPPLRTKEDIHSLLEGLQDGTIDAVASDHAPHAKKEKQAPFTQAPFGVVGLETAFLVLLTLVKKDRLSLTQAIKSMTTGPAAVLCEWDRIGTMLTVSTLNPLKNATLIDPNFCAAFSERRLVGRSKNSPFIGMELFGRVEATFLNGQLAHQST